MSEDFRPPEEFDEGDMGDEGVECHGVAWRQAAESFLKRTAPAEGAQPAAKRFRGKSLE